MLSETVACHFSITMNISHVIPLLQQVPSDGQNEFVKQYLAQREKLFQQQKEQKKKVEEGTSDRTTFH